MQCNCTVRFSTEASTSALSKSPTPRCKHTLGQSVKADQERLPLQVSPPEGAGATEGAAEETKLELEMSEMRTRLAVARQEAKLLVEPGAKLRACLAANSALLDGFPLFFIESN